MTRAIIQIFGTRKCADTRKAERYFSERNVRVQMIDLAKKGMSPGELRSVAARVGGFEALIDRGSKRYIDAGLAHAALTDARIEEKLTIDPLLMKTPVVRNGQDATIGYTPGRWQEWIAQGC
jgi:arsenate reductase-like glutaredoxin family protein